MKKPFSRGLRRLPYGLVILYEDRDLLVVDKPPGLLTVATVHEKSRTVHSILTEYFRAGCGKSRKRLFIVHRLDRDTSGVLLFAKSEEAMYRLKANWPRTEKKYLAVVHGVCEPSGTITSHLAEDADYFVFSTSEDGQGRLARTDYRLLKVKRGLSLLEVTLLTGRKNQIRVHMTEIGHPIVGDTKYGKKDDLAPRLALHARSISFPHPFSGKRLTFEAPAPEFFKKLVGPLEGPEGAEGRPGCQQSALDTNGGSSD
ncbi:MAG: RluA family pseudouridine synthase [Deltaproteobacteria bacterium]|nr:RluA family pseudouridine synthase [Deltaproteobacteria bacterium]